MNIHIHRGGQQHGPYPVDQLKTWLASGELSASVMCSLDGGTSWIPVHCIPEIRGDESLSPIIRTATSGDVDIEARIIDETIKELEEMMSNTDPASIANVQGRLQWKLRILTSRYIRSKRNSPIRSRREFTKPSFIAAKRAPSLSQLAVGERASCGRRISRGVL